MAEGGNAPQSNEGENNNENETQDINKMNVLKYKEIYYFSKDSYDKELKRSNEIDEKNGRYLLFCSIFTSAIAIIINTVNDLNFKILLAIPLILVFIALILSLYVLKLRPYAIIYPTDENLETWHEMNGLKEVYIDWTRAIKENIEKCKNSNNDKLKYIEYVHWFNILSVALVIYGCIIYSIQYILSICR